jgi:hypothetical protein
LPAVPCAEVHALQSTCRLSCLPGFSAPESTAKMPLQDKYLLVMATLFLSTLARPDCLPFEQAKKHVGEIKCVTLEVPEDSE